MEAPKFCEEQIGSIEKSENVLVWQDYIVFGSVLGFSALGLIQIYRQDKVKKIAENYSLFEPSLKLEFILVSKIGKNLQKNT